MKKIKTIINGNTHKCNILERKLNLQRSLKLKVVVIGCGRIAKKHIGLLSDEFSDECEIVGICDIDTDKMIYFSNKYQLQRFTSIETMMKICQPDIAVILSDSGNHGKHILTATDYPVKAIICEKPLCLDLSEAKKVIDICSLKKIELFLVKQNRLNPPVKKMLSTIKQNRLGKLMIGGIRVRWCRKKEYYSQDSWRGTWALDGGALTNQASHHVDLLLEAMGPISSVNAYTATMLANIEAEDTAIAILKFANGALGTIEVTTATRPTDIEGSISILGSKGIVEIGGFAVNEIKTWEVENFNLPEDELQSLNEKPPNVYGFSHLRYYRLVFDDMRDKTQKATRGIDGLKSLDVIHAIYESAHTNTEVNVGSNYEFSRLGSEI